MPRTLSEQEFNQVRQSVLQSAPPNMDEATFTRWVGPQFAAAIAEAETRPVSPQGSAIDRAASSFGTMINPLTAAQGIYQAVRHPIDTGTAILGQMGDQWSQGLDLAKQGRYVEGAGHMAAGSLPVIGPTAAQIGEQAASGDRAGAVGATAGLFAPMLVKPGLNALRRAAPEGLRATVAEHLEAKGAQRVADVMSPKIGANKTRFGNMADQVAPELAKNPDMAAWSRAGLQAKVQQAFEAAQTQLDEAADARNVGKAFDTKPILDALQEARNKLVAEPVDASRPIPSVENGVPQGRPIGETVEPKPNAPRIGAIDDVIAEVKQLGPIARYESLRRIRQAWDSVAKPIYNESMTADYLKVKGNALGAADATGALREHLATFEPATDAANQKYSLYKKANDVLTATAEVERTRPRVGRAIIARLTGTILGGEAGGTVGAAAGFVLGPTAESVLAAGGTTKIQTAQLMTRLAAAIRTGDVATVDSTLSRLQRMVPTSAVQISQQAGPIGAARQTGRPDTTAAR